MNAGTLARRRTAVAVFVAFLFPGLLVAQSDARQVEELVGQPLVSPAVVVYQLDQFLMKRVPKIEVPKSREEWTAARSHTTSI